MRKFILEPHRAGSVSLPDEIDLCRCARILVSSEATEHPVENMLDGRSGPGATYWTGERPNVTEAIVFEFDEPQRITRLMFEAEEHEGERTQEVCAQYSIDGGNHYSGMFVQEYTFSPGGGDARAGRSSLRSAGCHALAFVHHASQARKRSREPELAAAIRLSALKATTISRRRNDSGVVQHAAPLSAPAPYWTTRPRAFGAPEQTFPPSSA